MTTIHQFNTDTKLSNDLSKDGLIDRIMIKIKNHQSVSRDQIVQYFNNDAKLDDNIRMFIFMIEDMVLNELYLINNE